MLGGPNLGDDLSDIEELVTGESRPFERHIVSPRMTIHSRCNAASQRDVIDADELLLNADDREADTDVHHFLPGRARVYIKTWGCRYVRTRLH